MSCRGLRSGSLTLLVFAAVSALGQSRPLNPTVTVLPRAVAPVPAECDIGPGPDIRVAELQSPPERSLEADLAPPPSSDLRSILRNAQEAAEANDRATFSDAVTRARATLANYPSGGEKNAANDVIAVYSDLLRLWNYQFDSPTGAFLDQESEGGALVQMMNRYPAWPAFIADQTITAGGRKIYPTRESRAFLTAEAARRLPRLGVQPPAPRQPPRPAPPTRTVETEPAGTPPGAMPSVVPRRRTPSTTQPSTTQPSTSSQPQRSEPRVATTTPRRTTPPRATATPAKAAAKPSPPPAPPTDEELAALGLGTSTVAPAPVTPVAPPRADTAAIPPAAATTTQAVPITDTTVTTETISAETATTAEGTPPLTPARGPNFIIPLILILIGIGVLIVLFRASS
jgi:hypothetical protein